MATQRIIFLDEAGVDVGMSQSQGWARVGETPVIERPMGGTRVSLLGAMDETGGVSLQVVHGNVNGEVFLGFLHTELCPHLHPGDIVVLDGARIHRVTGVREAIEKTGATIRYLPAYTPELNPIEWAWSWLKRRLRKAPPRELGRLIQKVREIWKLITNTLCKAWVQGCGYVQST